MEETKQQGQTITPSLQSFRNAIRNLDISGIFYFFFISFAKKKKKTEANKQTSRKNVGRDTATAVANYIGSRY